MGRRGAFNPSTVARLLSGMRSPAHFPGPSSVRLPDREPEAAPRQPTLAEPAAAAPPLGEMLLANGLLEQDDLDKALAFQADYGGRLGSILVRMGALSESDLLQVLSHQLATDVLEPEDLPKATQPFASAIEISGL